MAEPQEPDIVTEIVRALEIFSGGALRDAPTLTLLLACVQRTGRTADLGAVSFQGAAVTRLGAVLERQAPESDERAGLERAYAEALEDFHRSLAALAAAADADLRGALEAAALQPTLAALDTLRALAADLSLLKDWERVESGRGAEQDSPDAGA
jgi:hypothetical protein